MTAPSDLPTLYKARKVYLWVEDIATRTYLDAVWSDPEIGILVAGGHENVHAVVKSSRQDNFTQVFGFRDRDFGHSNRARWGDQGVDVMTCDAFEIENLALDSGAMAACEVNTSHKNASQIEAEMQAIAADLAWWMSCRHAITGIRDGVTRQFIEHPRRGAVTTRTDAERAIFTSAWWTTVLPAIGTTVTEADVLFSLQQHHESYVAMLANGQWQARYSGKEILRDIVARVWTQKHSPRLHLDFVQAIGRAQRAMGRIPDEVSELRAALRRQVGLPAA